MREAKFLAVALDADSGETVRVQESPAGEGAVRIKLRDYEAIDLWINDLKTILNEIENWQKR